MDEPARTPVKPRTGYPALYLVSFGLMLLALVGVAALVMCDLAHSMADSSLHQHMDAWPLTVIGLSLIVLQLVGQGTHTEKVKGFLLGLAFVLWGSEQLLSPARYVTLMDEAVVAIFVIDVAWIVSARLKHSPTDDDLA